MTHMRAIPALAALLWLCAPVAQAQTTGPAAAKPVPDTKPAPDTAAAKPADGAPAPLVVLFPLGSATLRPQDTAVLDRASRAYNEGRPIVMVLTGSSDSVGKAEANLLLSQRRAAAVLNGLLERGIPAERFQVLAKGQTDPAVPARTGVAEPQNRRVEITWR